MEDEYFSERLLLALLLPGGASLLLAAWHAKFPDSYFPFQLMPYAVSLFLFHRYGKELYRFREKRFFTGKYISRARAGVVLLFFLALGYFSWIEDVSVLVNYGTGYRSGTLVFIFPFVLSGYVLPFLLLPHVLAESLSLENGRVTFISITLILVCLLVWFTLYFL